MSADLFGNRGAHLSECGRYRYVLWRTWDNRRLPLGWIMLNPSTADANEDDPTIRRCISFAKREGYGGVRVANLYPLRATDPAELLSHTRPVDAAGNDPFAYLVFCCDDIVAAWGAVNKRHRDRVHEVLHLGGAWTLLCLGVTKGGDPRHPLYVRGDQPLAVWRAAAGKPIARKATP